MSTLTAEAKEILDEFSQTPDSLKLELLLEYSDSLPELPEEYRDRPELLERVEECQSPVYLITEVSNDNVSVHLTAPREAPTTRAFAAILQRALTCHTPEQVLQFDDGFIAGLGLAHLVSALRLHGMHGMLNRIKRQVRERN